MAILTYKSCSGLLQVMLRTHVYNHYKLIQLKCYMGTCDMQLMATAFCEALKINIKFAQAILVMYVMPLAYVVAIDLAEATHHRHQLQR